MPQKLPQNHHLIWTDLLNDLDISSNWWQVISHLYYKEHGYSNYIKCLARNHDRVRQDVYLDKRIKQYLHNDDADGHNRQKIERILDEMCHLLTSQSNPSRRIKFAGTFFLKSDNLEMQSSQFKEQYLQLTKEYPVVILPTHRSYMDFLFISYIMTHYELPLPIVATGDNFKAMGKLITDYLKSTGGFLIRRTAGSRTDVEANLYYDILRAYVHSVLKGGEHPMEFFMEGTRTRVGQVLRPKTGLLSMVVDMLIDNIVDDIYILPVAINYQRPIEEQLYIGENTPQINMRKPRESATNLVRSLSAIMKRQYGKVYVRFFEPFKLSEYFEEWKKVTGTKSIESGDRDSILHAFTNSLASKVCLEQATNNILMPFNLITCSILAESFMQNFKAAQRVNQTSTNGYHQDIVARISCEKIVEDFERIEKLLQAAQPKFIPGWQSHLDILDEFKLDRDNIVRASEDRKYVEFNLDALTFQTMLYYSNQTIQILLPVAICFLLPLESDGCWEQYREIRSLLSYEFFANDSFMEHEFNWASSVITQSNPDIPHETRKIIIRHLNYFVDCYLKFFNYMLKCDVLDRDEFFNDEPAEGESSTLFISKDMLKNMVKSAQDQGAVEVTFKEQNPTNGETKKRRRPEEVVTIKDRVKLAHLVERFERVRLKITNVILL